MLRGGTMGERQLIYEIIKKAIEDSEIDVTKIRGKPQRLEAERNKRSALNWLKSNSRQPMSFAWYCNLVDLDPEWARRKIKPQRVC
jgi:hypothetical protein